MPEGPEVKKVTDFLNENFKNNLITAIEIKGGRYKKHGPFEGFEKLKSVLPAKVTFVSCKGKFIWLEINNCYYLGSTLGMSGTWTKVENKHSHVAFTTASGEKIYFNDVRNFGTLKLFENQEIFVKKLNTIGPDLLNEHVILSDFRDRIYRQKNKTIAEALMNQKVVSGIGNYLKAECLYASKISPHRPCSEIKKEEMNVLFDACRRIIRLSYNSGGATISTYRQPNGEKGLYSRRFAVYNQKYDPDGNEVIKEQTRDKRTTHWVPSVQK